MDFDQTQAIYDYEEEEEERVKQDKTHAKKKEVAVLKVFTQQGFKETFFPIFLGDNVIGRDGKCNITIPIKALSKKHACIEVQRDLHLIYDCESKNRTKKGKSFLKPTIRYELKHGDMLMFGDVKCQYVVDLDTEEDEGETGSETESESMLPEATTEEELDGDKPIVHEDVPIISNAKSSPPGDELREPVQVSQRTKKPAGEGEEEAYMYAADSDTDDERPLAAAAMLTVLYSSEEEHETPVRQKTTKVHMKQKNSMEGQTLAFGLGSPDNVFRNRDSSGSSHAGQTAGSIPQTLMLSSDSDAQSDGKGGQLSSGNRQSSAPKHPEAPHNTANQPTCEPTLVYESDGESPMKRPTNRKAIVSDPSCQPTLLYGSESDDGSPLKKPKHPEADVSKELDPTCPPTLPCETEDGSPVKKPTYRGVANVPTVLNESDSEESTDNAACDSESNKHIQQVVSSSPGIAVEDKRDDNQMQSVTGEAEATVLYAAAEMSSTDDEGEPETNADVEKPTDHNEPTQLSYSAEKSGGRKLNDDDNMVTDEYGDDCATQPYAMDSDFNTEGETITLVGVDTSDANQTTKLSDVEATQAYCVEDEKEEEEDSNSSNSQPLPIGPTSGANQGDIAAATLAYGLEATQAYNTTEKDDETDDEQDQDDRGSHCNDADPTLAYDLQSTQAYGVSKEDDNTDDEDNDKNESRRERVEGQSCELETKIDGRDAVQATIPYGLESTQAYGVGEGDNTDDEDNDKNESCRERVEGKSCELQTKVNGGDAVQATMPYGLESTQAYGADKTDDEDSKDWDMADSREDESRGDRAALASGLAETLPYGGHDDDDDNENNDDENENQKVDELQRQENQATLAYGLEETQAYDAESNDTDSASYSAIEATQAYGIEETFEAEVQTKPKKDAVKKMTTKRVAFAGSSSDEKDDETLVTETGEQNQPSTSSAADMEEEFQESEDFIQPRSRSRRGRKKLVIEESQEDESQQTSERSSSSKGKSSTPNTKGNKQSQGKNAMLDSTSDTTKQVQATCEGLEDETPTTTAASRKGRRGAMRVTIEADESDEEDTSQESSTKRGSRGKKAVQEESNKNGHSSTAGRKRGRHASKVTVEESDVEVKETPVAPKSRRGRKGKADQSSVSETPLKVTLDTADVADPQESTATDVESRNTRRGGRGRGRKGTAAATVKETPETTDSITLEVSVTSTEVRSQASAAPPTRGKGRGRGRKTQSLSTEMEIPEATSAIDEEEQQPSESPAVSVASKGRGRGRQGRGKRSQPSRSAALESSEDVSQILSTPESSEGSQTRKGRGRGKVSSEQEPSSDLEVAETPAKKSRRGKEPSVAQSPSLRQGKQAAESNPRVIFTGLVDKQGEKVVTSLGGELVNNIHDCTHLVTDKVRRTVKFLCGLASGQVIVLPSWLDACKRAKSFVDTTPFLVKDKEAEKQYKFDLHRSHEAALNQGLLDGYKVHVTKKVLPDPSQMKDIIQSAKGEFLSSMPRGKEDKVFVISCKEDRGVCKKPLEAGIPVVSAEVLLTGILRQELNLEEFKLFEDELSDTSQDTTKRRREQSETATPPSVAEKKSSGSKRRKK